MDSSVDHKHSINDATKINPSWWGRNNDIWLLCARRRHSGQHRCPSDLSGQYALK
ncbi:hypothetical protein J6590_000528 [Homalodisca vitripennis]|nr:hypothetical protein J6590_000528 [Homalodisca vitripennis]